MSLTEYKKKRSFDKTPEPTGGKPTDKKLHFVGFYKTLIQMMKLSSLVNEKLEEVVKVNGNNWKPITNG